MTDADRLINQIEGVRARNNTRWMDIVRIAMKHAPDETRAVLRDIYDLDGQVRGLTLRLADGDYAEYDIRSFGRPFVGLGSPHSSSAQGDGDSGSTTAGDPA